MSQQREAIDTYLLRVLHTLLVERSVTRTAIKLNQSQPTISAALRRLRDLTGDPLLVRGKSGMVPTEHGLWLLHPVRSALYEIERIAHHRPVFDPATSTRRFHIASPDYVSPMFVPTIVEDFRRLAPRANLDFHTLGPGYDHLGALESGQFDLVIGNWSVPPERMHLSPLITDEIVCLLSASHPYARHGLLTLDQYLKAPHVVPAPYAVGQRGAIDTFLAQERLTRNVVVTLPYFNLVPYALVNSDLIFTTTRMFAQHFANQLPLCVMPAPLAFPPMRYYQLWHERIHHSEDVRWLRNLVSDAVRTLHSRYTSEEDAASVVRYGT
ncbi:LysR family transcriptional regulator [Paraburkholderia silvatlantica]|uniref:LysR family transcriptional regulator n=1 Tax=Paraburkholderia silvatlantica TaxID=321895 RepID=A0A2V4TG97_9BURK|nr:LysR substrate-binding domain-containing protein [Paraburkholderia silvatlantica]PYE18401.1 LysR family transcriptional regulator [Paraburkholderia silvatlantica]